MNDLKDSKATGKQEKFKHHNVFFLVFFAKHAQSHRNINLDTSDADRNRSVCCKLQELSSSSSSLYMQMRTYVKHMVNARTNACHISIRPEKLSSPTTRLLRHIIRVVCGFACMCSSSCIINSATFLNMSHRLFLLPRVVSYIILPSPSSFTFIMNSSLPCHTMLSVRFSLSFLSAQLRPADWVRFVSLEFFCCGS